MHVVLHLQNKAKAAFFPMACISSSCCPKKCYVFLGIGLALSNMKVLVSAVGGDSH